MKKICKFDGLYWLKCAECPFRPANTGVPCPDFKSQADAKDAVDTAIMAMNKKLTQMLRASACLED